MHGLIIVLLCSALCVNSFVVTSSESESNKIPDDNICRSDSCARASKKMLSFMDESIDPCDDFYEFACGGYLRKTVIPDDKSSLTAFSTIQDKIDKQIESILTEEPQLSDKKPFKLAKILTKICLDETTLNKNGIQPMVDILERFGGWPVVKGSNWKSEDWDWLNIGQKISKDGLDAIMLESYISIDLKNTSKRIVAINRAPFGLEQKFLLKGMEHEFVKAYYDFMVDTAVIFGANKTNAEFEFLDVLQFETELAKISISDEERRNKSITYNPFTIQELQKTYPYINWLEFINGNLLGLVEIDENETVIVVDKNYLMKLNDILQSTSKRTISNYYSWRLGLPSCPVSLEALRSHLPYLGYCLNFSEDKHDQRTDDDNNTNNNNNFVIGDLYGNQKDQFTPNLTPLHRFYREQQQRKKMPGFRGRRGLCGCFQDDEPPEICVVEGALTLQTLTATQPMPSIEELDAKFAELVEEFYLTAPNKAAMLSLPSQKKWQIYCSRKSPIDSTDGTEVSRTPPTPEHYIERLKDISKQFQSRPDESPCHEYNFKIESHTAFLDALKTALRTSAHSFVLRFVELNGLSALLEILRLLDIRVANSPMHSSLIGCLKTLMNNSTGRAHVLSHPTSINIIAQSLAADNIKTKIAALEILGAVCLVPGGHKKVLMAMLHFQQYAAERTRFQSIINDLDRSTGAYRDDVNLKTAIMSFINAVLNYGPGQENLEFRLHLCYEFLMLGLQPVIDKLRQHENETLDRHLDFFEMVRNEDEKELARKFGNEHVDTKSATAMFELLRRKLSHSPAYGHLLSLLQHMLLLPFTGPNTQHWLIFDRVVQQIILQNNERPTSDIIETEGDKSPDTALMEKKLQDPDHSIIEIDVKQIVQLLVKEEELVAARTKAEEMEKENLEMQSKLAKKEQEFDLRMQEKEDLETSLARMRERLEKESANHSQTVQRALNAEMKIEDLQHKFAQEQHERMRLERLVSEGSIPDDQKISGLSGTTNGLATPATPKSPKASITAAAPPPPPPPLVMPPPPPPVPKAPAMSAPALTRTESIKKNVPQPTNPLKSFNWSKLPDAKVQGTIWSELDYTKLYTNIELENIDKLFCAYQKNGVPNDGSVEDLRLMGKGRAKILSVIDGRRAQNCTILLSKLKMLDEDISKAILSMDTNEQLPIDMVEQLLKFTPSAEERALLDEHSEDIESLARADRFLYEISKITHYEQRLRSLHYKKRFMIAVNDLKPRIQSVMEASREVARSRRLRKLLEVVLALGNYMNRGARGNACGFRLASLNRLADTKSSSAKGTTLLHYLVEVVEKKFKDVLKLEEDIPHVRQAAKVSLGEMDKDISLLRNGLVEVSREIEFNRSVGTPPPGDRFLPVMREFHASAPVRFAQLEDMFQDMKTRFDRADRLFGEDGSVIQPDEFFGIFDSFLSSFMEARQDNKNFKKRQEEEEKRAKQEAELKKRTIERKNKEGLLISVAKNLGFKKGDSKAAPDNEGEFDDLISALRTGDVFGEDMAKFKRSRKTRMGNSKDASGSNTSPPRHSSSHREESRERTINLRHN